VDKRERGNTLSCVQILETDPPAGRLWIYNLWLNPKRVNDEGNGTSSKISIESIAFNRICV
jgi:hypothetical protein